MSGYWRKWSIWFAAGVLAQLLFLDELLAVYRGTVAPVLQGVPGWGHVLLLVLLFAILLSPAQKLWLRYRRTVRLRSRPFTALDAGIVFLLGLTTPGFFGAFTIPLPDDFVNPRAHPILVWLLGATAFVLAVTLRRSEVASGSKLQVPSDPLLDSPIFDESQDVLGRGSFVEDFHKQLSAFPGSESFVFSLGGAWGMGKTSTLNLLRNRLHSDDRVVLVDFNPWYFSSIESVVHRFYLEIASAINKRFLFPNLSSTARRYSRLLSPVIKHYGLDFTVDEPSTEEIKTRIQSFIDQTERRLVILVDDVDRLQTDELLALFKTVRLAATFRNTIFVLAFDEKQVAKRLAEARIDRDFLGKIIQSPIQLPPVDQTEINYFLLFSTPQRRSHLDRLFDKLEINAKERAAFDEKIVVFYLTCLQPFFGTLRNAKRFLSSFGTRLPAVKDEVHLLDFFLLEILRVFANDMYEDIWRNRYYYIPAWTWAAGMSSPFGFFEKDDEKCPKIKAHVDALLKDEPHSANVLKILKEMFFSEIEKAYGRGTNYDGVSDVYRAEKRITHAECFDKYFLLKVPEGILSDASVEAEMKQWQQSLQPSKAILDSIVSHHNNGTLSQLFDRLLVFIKRLDEAVAEDLANCLALNVHTFSREGDFSETDKALRLIIFLLNNQVPDARRQPLLEGILRRLTAIDVAVNLVGTISSPEATRIHPLKQDADVKKLRSIIKDRFQREFIQPKVNIFDAAQESIYVLAQIGQYDSESKAMVSSYVQELCAGTPQLVGRLTRGYMTKWASDHVGFRFQDLASLYDAKRLAAIADQAGQNAWSTPDEEKAVKLLLDAVKRQSD